MHADRLDITRPFCAGTPKISLGTPLVMRGTLIHWCPPEPLERPLLPVIVGTCRRKGIPMPAVDDALAETRARHPYWTVWISSAGRYWATRRGSIRLTENVHPGWAMTVDADSLAKLETRIKEQEAYGQGAA